MELHKGVLSEVELRVYRQEMLRKKMCYEATLPWESHWIGSSSFLPRVGWAGSEAMFSSELCSLRMQRHERNGQSLSKSKKWGTRRREKWDVLRRQESNSTIDLWAEKYCDHSMCVRQRSWDPLHASPAPPLTQGRENRVDTEAEGLPALESPWAAVATAIWGSCASVSLAPKRG